MTRLADTYRVPPAAELPDDLDPETRAQAKAAELRHQVIASLRNLTQMLVDHPELPTPTSIRAQVSMHGYAPDEDYQVVARAAAVLGQPIDQDDDTATSVTAELSDYRPNVAYTVYAAKPKPTPVHPADDPTRSPAQRDAGRLLRKTGAALDAMDAEGGEGR